MQIIKSIISGLAMLEATQTLHGGTFSTRSLLALLRHTKRARRYLLRPLQQVSLGFCICRAEGLADAPTDIHPCLERGNCV